MMKDEVADDGKRRTGRVAARLDCFKNVFCTATGKTYRLSSFIATWRSFSAETKNYERLLVRFAVNAFIRLPFGTEMCEIMCGCVCASRCE